MIVGMILYPDGTQKETHPADGKEFSLDELHAIVDGYIEIIPTKDGRLIVLNEEGRLLGLPRNEQATQLAVLATTDERAKLKDTLASSGIRVVDLNPPGEEDYVAGTVLVCVREELE